MPGTVRLAAIPLAVLDGRLESNYDRALRLVEIALEAGPDLVLLPEAYAAGYCGTDMRPYAEPVDGPWQEALRELSGRSRCVLVSGFLEKVPEGIRNSVAVFEDGVLRGVHAKTAMWPDDKRPYRDEVSLLVPGTKLEVFATRVGRFGVLICYENRFPEKWDALAPQVDFVLSPYNCEGDPSCINQVESPRVGRPSAWACRTGTVYQGPEGWGPNLGTAGLVDAEGNVIAISREGVEEIVVAELTYE
jgi:predicted amidohydrolase